MERFTPKERESVGKLLRYTHGFTARKGGKNISFVAFIKFCVFMGLHPLQLLNLASFKVLYKEKEMQIPLTLLLGSMV